MKKYLLVLVLFLMVVLPVFSKNILFKELSAKKGQLLDVNFKLGGAIDIKGWDKEKIEVRIDFKGEDEKNWKIEITPNKNGYKIISDRVIKRKDHYGPVFIIFIPEKYDLNIRTTGGSISINNIDGKINGETKGGNLNLRKLKGEIDLTTYGGKIDFKNSNIDGIVTTKGGLVILENIVGDIKGKSMGGEVIYKNVKYRNGNTSGKIVKISTMGGPINVDDAPDGAEVLTHGGNIIIKKAGKFVKAKTMGGNILIKSVNGWIKATTMSGNIKAIMTGNPKKGKRDVNLISMNGDITLIVPNGLSMEIDITLAYTKNRNNIYRIISDFKINKKRTVNWDYINSSNSKKYIYGTGIIGDGKNKIKISTINGNVYIKNK